MVRITRGRRFLAALGIAILAVSGIGGAAHAAPATPAATATYLYVTPYLRITAMHQSVFVYGYDFANGQTVGLQAYGITSTGLKVPLAYRQVTAVAPVPYTLDFQWDFAQAQDPCYGGGYPSIEVDAYGQSRFAGIWYFITRATASVQCGDILY